MNDLAFAFTEGKKAFIDKYIDTVMNSESIPGLVLGIFSNGESILAKGYGLANVERGIPIDIKMAFHIGSAAIMILVEEGRLRLDDSICKYFKDVMAGASLA